MCDTIVATGEATVDGTTIFGTALPDADADHQPESEPEETEETKE